MMGISRQGGIIFTIVVLLAVVGQVQDLPADGASYIHQGVRIPYEIRVPEGWEVIQITGEHLLAILQPWGVEGTYPRITVALEYGHIDAPYLPERFLDRELFNHSGSRLICSEWKETDGGRILLAEIGWSSVYGDLQAVMAIIPVDNDVVTLACTTLAVDFDEYRDVFAATISSLKLKEAPLYVEEDRFWECEEAADLGDF